MRAFKPWRIVHVSLREPLPDLPLDASSDGVFVVFWDEHVPLGQLLIRAPLLPMPSAQLGADASRIVAPSVAFRTVKDGFEPQLPVPEHRQPPVEHPVLSQLLELDAPLTALLRARARCHQPVGVGRRLHAQSAGRSRAVPVSAGDALAGAGRDHRRRQRPAVRERRAGSRINTGGSVTSLKNGRASAPHATPASWLRPPTSSPSPMTM